MTPKKMVKDYLYIILHNTCIKEKMKFISYNNYIKSNICYRILYTVELYKRLKNGEKYQNIRMDYNRHWIKKIMDDGKKILEQLNG